MESAVLPGYRRVRARHGNYPVLLRRCGSRLPGLLIRGLDRDALYRVAHFEGSAYQVGAVRVLDQGGQPQAAWVFLGRDKDDVSLRAWEVDRWRLSRDKPRVLRQTRLWMKEYGLRNNAPQDVGWRVRRQIQASVGDTETWY